ncbi:hypothetical protein Zm00014a_007448 [Zea mays]|uniref:Uncharacterized protein n=1 Tax=Zea mays TaxID=4577 RepID=A0A3L6FMQ9_MAIZE|nr:hypothetical protein Zm00014a_007448 [Zea mays]
MQYRMSYSMHV